MAYTSDMTPGYHGNRSHSIRAAEMALSKGVPFRDEMLALYEARLARWGFGPEDLEEHGIQGDIVDQTCKLGVITDLLWAALLNAAALGQEERWQMLEKKYAGRLNQSLRWMADLVEKMGEAHTKTLDYQDILALAQEMAQE